MSAVATAAPAVTPHLHEAAHAGPSAHVLEMAEQKRWMVWFGLPALVAALFVGVTIGTGQEWWLGLAIAAMVTDVGVMVWLAMSSDTNGLIGDAPSH